MFEALIWFSGEYRVLPESPPRYRHSPFSVPLRPCAIAWPGKSKVIEKKKDPKILRDLNEEYISFNSMIDTL